MYVPCIVTNYFYVIFTTYDCLMIYAKCALSPCVPAILNTNIYIPAVRNLCRGYSRDQRRLFISTRCVMVKLPNRLPFVSWHCWALTETEKNTSSKTNPTICGLVFLNATKQFIRFTRWPQFGLQNTNYDDTIQNNYADEHRFFGAGFLPIHDTRVSCE